MEKSLHLKPILKLIILSIMCLGLQRTEAQTSDRILTKDSTILFVLITKITKDSVFFKYYGQSRDSVSAMPLLAIHKILYKNKAIRNYSIEAVDSADAKTGFMPIYLDLSAGFGVGALTEYSAGIRWNEKNAFGVSRLIWIQFSDCCATNANGIGVQWRFTPNKKLFTKFEVGYIKAARFADDGNYRAVYNYQKSNKIYQRVTVARSFSIFTAGLTIIRASGQVNDNFDYNTQKYLHSLTFGVRAVVLNLGLAIPPFYKSRRKSLFRR